MSASTEQIEPHATAPTISTTHTLQFSGRCPLGPEDHYEASIHAGPRFIEAGFISKLVSELTSQPIYQEHLTQQLADRLCCRVVTQTRHGRVSTTCVADPSKK